MELVELINLILPLISKNENKNNFDTTQSSVQQNNSETGQENTKQMQAEPDFSSAFFSLPNYKFSENTKNFNQNQKDNQSTNQNANKNFYQNNHYSKSSNTSQNFNFQSNTQNSTQQNDFSNQPKNQNNQGFLQNGFNINNIISILNLLKQLDLKSIKSTITSLFTKTNQSKTENSEKEKDTEVSFKNNYTKVDTYNYD